MKLNILSCLLFLFLFSGQLLANDPIEVALHSSGKIYLVIGTLAIIFVGIIIYLFSIDSHLTKIENQIKDNE